MAAGGRAGHRSPVGSVELEGIDHFEIVDPTEAPSVLDMIFEAIPPGS